MSFLARCVVIAVVCVFAFHSYSFSEEPSNSEEDYACISCHNELDDVLKDVVEEWKGSVHEQAGIRCHDCHGGNPADFELAMDPSEGFKGKITPKKIPELCSGCHSDSRHMRIYNLPSTQFEDYKKSIHGAKLLEQNDEKSPSCTSCHGKHKILRVADPDSPVNRNNIVRSCSSCHSNQELMESRGIAYDQYEQYKGSVHGRPYFEQQDQGVPTCIDCHSNHAIIKPQTMSVRLACTRCHVEQEEKYKDSAHWDAAQRTGEPLCIHCHANHGIEKPGPDIFVSKGLRNCNGCHRSNSMQMETATKLFDFIDTARKDVDSTSMALAVAMEWSGSGFEISHLKQKLEKAKKTLLEMATAQHAMDVTDIEANAKKISLIKDDVVLETDRMQTELMKRKIGLAITWVVFFAFSWALANRAGYCKRK